MSDDVAYIECLPAQEAAYWTARQRGWNINDKQVGDLLRAAAPHLRQQWRDEQLGRSSNLPVPMTYEALAAILRGMADMVETGDSLEGSVEYTFQGEQDLGPDEVMVRAAFRIGNTMGQGGMRIIGTLGGGPA